MKKFVAILVLVCIALMPAALAEQSITWEEVGAPIVESSELEGDFISLSDMGLAVWVPSDLVYTEPSEEDAANGRYALFVDEDQSSFLTVDAIYVEGMTLDQALENAVANGMTDPEVVNINGLDIVTYADDTNNIGCAVLVDTNCNMIIFSFGPVDSDAGKLGYTVIASSIMPLE